jgi:hypothetical protein
MFKIANFSLVLVTLATASVLYSLEHNTRGYERDISRAKALMVDQSEAIKLLNAEWSSLTRPERLQQLVEKNLGYKTVEADQFVTTSELPARLDALAKTASPNGGGSIDDILKKMQ